MLIDIRKKPDLTFARIYHTGIYSRKIRQQYCPGSHNIKNTCCEGLG